MKFIILTAALLSTFTSSTSEAQTLKNKILGAIESQESSSSLGEMLKDKSIESVEKSTELLISATQDLAVIKDQLTTLGFTISTVRMQMLPPSGTIRLVSFKQSVLESSKIDINEDANLLQRAVLTAAYKSKLIQSNLGLGVIYLDIKISRSPSIKMTFKEKIDDNKNDSLYFGDLDLACNEALQ